MLVDSLTGPTYTASLRSHAIIWSDLGCADLDSGFACFLTLSVATAMYSERTPSEQLRPTNQLLRVRRWHAASRAECLQSGGLAVSDWETYS